MLLLEANRTVAIDRIVDVLWAHEPPATARTMVQGYVSRLRQRLTAHDPEDGGARIVTRRPGYQLVVDEARIDRHRAQRLLADARREPAARRAEMLRHALRLWRGEALADVADRVRAPELVELKVAVLEARVDADLELGRHAELVGELSEHLEDHPFAERLAGQLVLALYRCGRRASALETYQRFARRMADERGIDPGPELRDLQARVLADDVTLLPETLGAQRVGPLVPAQLPTTPPGFNGRDAELAWLDDVLSTMDSSTVAIAVLAGPAGVGKTSLALRWGRGVVAEFPEGQLYVSLRGFDPQHPPVDPAEVLTQFLLSLGVAADEVPVALDDRAALYRSLLADRRVLVVLDDARDSAQVRPLLPAGSRSLVLVTSRVRLDGLVADGGRLLLLGTLPPDAALRIIEETARFADGVADLEQRRRLVELCGRLPLALRIVGARLAASPQWSVDELIEELTDERTRLGALDVEGAHTSVRAALDVTYRALHPAMAGTYRMLGLFPGRVISPLPVAALCSIDAANARRRLRALAAVFLVTEESPDTFVMHDLVRLHAGGLATAELGTDVRDAALIRLAHYYLVAGDHARRLLRPVFDGLTPAEDYPQLVPPDMPEADDALDWFEREWSNIFAVLRVTRQHGRHTEVWKIARVAQDFRAVRSRLDDWLSLVQLGLESARAAGDPVGEVWMLVSRCSAYSRFAMSDQTLTDAERALAIAIDLRDPLLMAIGYNTVASALYGQGRTEDAMLRYREALVLVRTTDNKAIEANLLNNIAQMEQALGRPAEAIGPQRAALELYRQTREHGFELFALVNLAELYLETGGVDEAETHARQGVLEATQSGLALQEAFARQVLGQVLSFRQDLNGAREQWLRSLELYTELKQPRAAAVRAELDALGT